MNQLEKVIIDADVCINLAKYEKKNALQCVLENIAQTVFVHEYRSRRYSSIQNAGHNYVDKRESGMRTSKKRC